MGVVDQQRQTMSNGVPRKTPCLRTDAEGIRDKGRAEAASSRDRSRDRIKRPLRKTSESLPRA